MIANFDANFIAQTASAVVLALVAIAVGFQKILKNWKESSTEVSIMKTLHEELERMQAQNMLLTSELHKLQKEILNLNRELIQISEENQRLHADVIKLTHELSRVQLLLSEKTRME